MILAFKIFLLVQRDTKAVFIWFFDVIHNQLITNLNGIHMFKSIYVYFII